MSSAALMVKFQPPPVPPGSPRQALEFLRSTRDKLLANQEARYWIELFQWVENKIREIETGIGSGEPVEVVSRYIAEHGPTKMDELVEKLHDGGFRMPEERRLKAKGLRRPQTSELRLKRSIMGGIRKKTFVQMKDGRVGLP